MQPPGPPRPFRGAQYDKDMFTFLPANSKRDTVSKASRKRKATVGDLQGKEFQSPARALKSRESSNFFGYSDQSQYLGQSDLGVKQHRNERGGYESRTEYAGFTSSSGQLLSPNHKFSSPSFPASEECTHRTLNFPPVTEDFNQHVNHEPDLQIATLKGPNGPHLVAEVSRWSKNCDLNAHVATQKTLDWHPLVFQDSFQHKIRESDAHIVAQKTPNFLPMMNQSLFPHGNCDSNAHVANHEILKGPPPLTQNLNCHEIQGLDAHVPRGENASHSQEIWSYSLQKAVQPRVMTSDSHEQASKYLGESQRLPQNGLKPGAVIEGLAEKDLYEEEAHKVGRSSNTKSKPSDTDSFAGIDSIKSSGNNVSSSVCNLQNETNNLLNVLRLLSAASGIALADNNDGNTQGGGQDVRMLKSSPGSSIHNLNHSPKEPNLSKNPGNCSDLDKPAMNVEKGSFSLGDECKSENGTSAFAEKLWDGTLQLSTSVSVSVIAFFKSGDKVQDFNWFESVEVKGKVRLEAFEKYVQGLPRSRSRGLMVMSLCWKEGSSDAGRKGMKEVAQKYKDGKRVGFAKLSTDVDLYICPHSDAVITILAKHGFFKGMTVIKDICDPLIGCVVWKKSSFSAPATKTAKTPVVGVESSRRDKSPEFSHSPQVDQDKQSIVDPDNNATTVTGSSSQPSKPIVPISSATSKQSADLSENDDDDLPEYDFTPGFQASASKISAEKKSESLTASASVPVPDSQLLEMVPENVKQHSEAHKPSFPTQNQGPEQQNLSQLSEVKIPSLPIQEQKPIEKPRNLFDDDDMPEWCPPDFMKTKKEETKRTEVPFSSSNSIVPGSGSAELGSGYLPPPPLPPSPPPPPLTQFQFKERDFSSAPCIPPPSISSNPTPNSLMHHNPAAPLTQMQCGDRNLAAMSTQMHLKDRYSSAPRVPPPPVGNLAPHNFMIHNPAAVSSQVQFKEREYSSSPRVPPPPVGNSGASKFTPNSPAAMSSQMQFKDTEYSCGRHVPATPVSNPAAANNFMQQSPTPHAPRLVPFANKPVSDGLIHQSLAFPPGFAPNPPFRPILDQSGMKKPIRPSIRSTRP